MIQRPLDALVDHVDPMWSYVREWITALPYAVEILPVERSVANATLLTLQVTTHATLGALAWETGGILVDHGWLRLLGATSDRMRDGVLAWNGLTTEHVAHLPGQAFMVAHDVAGGFFAMDGGAFGTTTHDVHYFAPDSLTWEHLGCSLTDFVHWALSGDLAGFYASVRWPGWEQEVVEMTGDQGMSFWPMLWAAADRSAGRSRRVVPLREVWDLQQAVAQQVTPLLHKTPIRLHFTAE
jgi:hypothetical protein